MSRVQVVFCVVVRACVRACVCVSGHSGRGRGGGEGVKGGLEVGRGEL